MLAFSFYEIDPAHYSLPNKISNKGGCAWMNGCCNFIINSQLLRCGTARVSSIGFSSVSPTKVEARKSFLFTESFLELKIKNTC